VQQQNSVMQSRQLNILNNQHHVRDQVSFVSELNNSALQRGEVTAEGSASFGTGIKVSTDTNIGLNSRSAIIENTKGVGLMASATAGAKLFASEKGVSGLFNSNNFSLGAGVAAGFSIAWDYDGNWAEPNKAIHSLNCGWPKLGCLVGIIFGLTVAALLLSLVLRKQLKVIATTE
jgi:hypothetical protein